MKNWFSLHQTEVNRKKLSFGWLSRLLFEFIWVSIAVLLLIKYQVIPYLNSWAWLSWVSFVWLSLSILLLNILSLFHFGFKSPQSIYILRTWYFLFFSESAIAQSIVAACHGVEYFGVAQKTFESSRIKDSEKRKAYYFGAALCLFGFIVLLLGFMNSIARQGLFDSTLYIPFWLKVVVCLTPTFTWIHQYLDRVIYTFKDPITREKLAPLLTNRFRISNS